MSTTLTFSDEITNLLHASSGTPLRTCIQCGTCSGTCPAVEFMDHPPRKIIHMIREDLRDQVMNSNTYWYCASCYYCTVRCPQEIDIAELMYALKRYSIWKHQYQEDLVGPVFSETFVKTIYRSGRSYEPIVATAYIRSAGLRELFQEAQTATGLMLKGRMPVIPPRIERIDNFRRMINRVVPMGGLQ